MIITVRKYDDLQVDFVVRKTENSIYYQVALTTLYYNIEFYVNR